MSYPHILVITPTAVRYHNGKRLDNLPRVKWSIERQTYPAIVHKVKQDTDRFAANSRNSLIRETNCKFVAYLDDDNWWEPDHLMRLYDNLMRRESSFAFSGSIIRTYNGFPLMKRIVNRPSFCRIDTNEILHKVELIDKYGGWQSKDNNDWLMVESWLNGGEPFASTGFATSNYTLRPSLKGYAKYMIGQLKHR